MPEYLMLCRNGHKLNVNQHMATNERVICIECGSVMWRKPQVVRVNWNGLKPSQGELHPELKELVDTAPERRAEFEIVHEEHERRTANED